jgi:hypothetical protein
MGCSWTAVLGCCGQVSPLFSIVSVFLFLFLFSISSLNSHLNSSLFCRVLAYLNSIKVYQTFVNAIRVD